MKKKIRTATGIVLLIAGIIALVASVGLALPGMTYPTLRNSLWIFLPYGVLVLIVAAILILWEDE